MAHLPLYPTPYPDVNELLDTLLSGVRAVLAGQFVGMYVHGSLASGDFDPRRSDVDFLVVTATELPADMVTALEALHARIAGSDLRWRTHYEGSYIPQQALRRFDPARALHPATDCEGHFLPADWHGSDWLIQRHILREQGIVLAGPDPRALIDPVSPDDLRRSVLGVLQEWWAPKLADPSYLAGSEYQAFAILTMCRALYTLEFGTVASKPKAARWAQERHGQRWSGLIARALAWHHGVELDCLTDTLAFLRYTLACAHVGRAGE